jgi:hypothetical protein
MSMEIISNSSISLSQKEILVQRINAFLLAKYNYEKSI